MREGRRVSGRARRRLFDERYHGDIWSAMFGICGITFTVTLINLRMLFL